MFEKEKEYLQCKVAAWKKRTKNDKEYFSLKIEIKEDVLKKMLDTKTYNLNANIFWKPKQKDSHPDYSTIENEIKTTAAPFEPRA